VIVAATPTRESVTAAFTGDLVKLCRKRPDVKWAAPIGIYIANLRNMAVNVARQMGASHLLFLDSDMRFPDDTVDRLLAADQDIVAANCVMRTMSELWVARANGENVSSVGRTGLQRVDSVGCGVMLIKLSVFDTLPRPWFSTPFTGQEHLGEDVYFCQQARAEGFHVWIDHDLSQAVRHTGSVELGVSL
jgi:hypothetical protein